MSHNTPQVLSFIEAGISTHGHAIIGVPGKPSFSYTIGLSGRLGYELIIVGMRCEHAGIILNDIADQTREVPLVMDVPDDRFANLPSVFKRCGPRVREYVIQADAYYEREVEAVQLVMCDRAGKFPWDAGYDTAYMGPLQPLLY